MKRLWLIYLLVVLAPALYVASVPAAQPVTTSLQVPLSGTVSVPLNDGSFDTVALTGQVHVKTQVPAAPAEPVRISVNLDQVSGVGNVTKLLYVATGANRINMFPPTPVIPLNLGFDLRAVQFPPDPIVPPDSVMPLDISLTLFFSVDTGELSANIDSMSVSVPE